MILLSYFEPETGVWQQISYQQLPAQLPSDAKLWVNLNDATAEEQLQVLRRFAIVPTLAEDFSRQRHPPKLESQTDFTLLIMRGYADNAQLNWVGGPLDGTYVSQDTIRGTWEKFGKAVGPLKVTINNLEESVNPKGATVLANVQFEGKMPIKVRYVLTYRDGKLVSETWQIDPKLAIAAY